MLPHHDLASFYDRVVWLYVCRTWKDDAKDREAARIHDRFGVTSWPHLLLIDPGDDRVIRESGRRVEDLVRAFTEAAAAVEPLPEGRLPDALALLGPEGGAKGSLDERLGDPSPHARLAALEELAAKGKRAATKKRRARARAWLEDPEEDLVLRLRSFQWLLGCAPEAAREAIGPLLATDNDAVRFAVLDALADAPDAALTPELVRLFAGAGEAVPSRNPNVLRMRAARCLGAFGDERAIDALAPVAQATDARNATTRVVVEALGAIAARSDKADAARVRAILAEAWPQAIEDAGDAGPTPAERMALQLVRAVKDAREQAGGRRAKKDPDLPSRWRPADREAWLEAVGKTGR